MLRIDKECAITTNIEKCENLGFRGKEIREFYDYMSDDEFNILTTYELLDGYLSYNGIIGYTEAIMKVITELMNN